MREALEEILFKEFPILYKNHRRCFEHGDGWFLILLNLSMKLEPFVLQFKEEVRDQFQVGVVKEKFGLLRFDCDFPLEDEIIRERMYAFINEAEDQSAITCEACGQAGTHRKTSWLHVHCNPCEEARVAKSKADMKKWKEETDARKLEKSLREVNKP